MNRIDVGIAVSYAILGGALVLAVGIFVAVSTLGRRRALDTERAGEHEKTWFAIVMVSLVALLFATIFFTPYGRSAEDTPQSIDVKAQQFAFVVGTSKIRAGEPVKFHLTSADVNHGFAVFNSDNTFLFQAQVMPGKTQDYVYTFKKPGTYRVLCFEYCGPGHDRMAAQLTVNAGG